MSAVTCAHLCIEINRISCFYKVDFDGDKSRPLTEVARLGKYHSAHCINVYVYVRKSLHFKHMCHFTEGFNDAPISRSFFSFYLKLSCIISDQIKQYLAQCFTASCEKRSCSLSANADDYLPYVLGFQMGQQKDGL